MTFLTDHCWYQAVARQQFNFKVGLINGQCSSTNCQAEHHATSLTTMTALMITGENSLHAVNRSKLDGGRTT